eukprot:Gb_05762 [translate_table: standard]
MGNHVSLCSSCNVPSTTVKVLLMNGSVQAFQRPIKAAEVMLENPQQFVCHSNALQIGRRISALSADEDLDLGHLYFLLPMQKLHSLLSASDMASLVFKANSVLKRKSKSTAKILPVFAYMCPLPVNRNHDNKFDGEFGMKEMKVEEMTEQEILVPRMNMDMDVLPFEWGKQRLNSCRSWKPMLETITEAPLVKG